MEAAAEYLNEAREGLASLIGESAGAEDIAATAAFLKELSEATDTKIRPKLSARGAKKILPALEEYLSRYGAEALSSFIASLRIPGSVVDTKAFHELEISASFEREEKLSEEISL